MSQTGYPWLRMHIILTKVGGWGDYSLSLVMEFTIIYLGLGGGAGPPSYGAMSYQVGAVKKSSPGNHGRVPFEHAEFRY